MFIEFLSVYRFFGTRLHTLVWLRANESNWDCFVEVAQCLQIQLQMRITKRKCCTALLHSISIEKYKMFFDVDLYSRWSQCDRLFYEAICFCYATRVRLVMTYLKCNATAINVYILSLHLWWNGSRFFLLGAKRGWRIRWKIYDWQLFIKLIITLSFRVHIHCLYSTNTIQVACW